MRTVGRTLRALVTVGPGNVRGVLLMVVGTLVATSSLIFIRFLGEDLPTVEVVFLRHVFSTMAMMPWVLRLGIRNVLRTERRGLHALRGAIGVVSTVAWYQGITMVPLAEALALNCLGTIFVTVGAILFLGETASRDRWVSVVMGFVGAWIILRPGIQAISPGALIVIFAAATWGISLLFMKVLTRTDSAVTIVLYLYVFHIVFTSVPAAIVWIVPTLVHISWLAIVGVLSSVGHLAMAQAFKEADATAVTPVDFTRLIWAALLGMIIFSEVPDPWTMVGAAVIFTSTTFLAYREAQSKSPDGGAGNG